jgi:hypothetical protein
MVVFKTKDIAAALTKKGFVAERGKRRKKHTFYFLYVNGKKTRIWTELSHGITEYSDDLLTSVRKQLKFEKNRELKEFIDCPTTYEKYVEMLEVRSIRY